MIHVAITKCLGLISSTSTRLIVPSARTESSVLRRALSSSSTSTSIVANDNADTSHLDRHFMHHGLRPRFRLREKFKSPRKVASSMLAQLNQEMKTESINSNPAVWEIPFRVGDAIEMVVVPHGGVNSSDREKMRGVVLGIFHKHMDTSVLIRDVLYGQPVERRIPLHSPLVKSLKVLEKNFVFKGKRKVKRAKLYYLSDRNPLETKVTK